LGAPWSIPINFEGGFIGQEITPDAVSSNHLISPSQNLLYSVLGQLESFQGCIAGLTNVGGPQIQTVGDTWVTLNGGTAAYYTGKSIWFNGGSGPVKTPNPSNPAAIVTLGTNSSILQVAVLKNGVYQTALQAGLSAPDAPVLAGLATPGVGFTGKNTGTFAAEISKIRITTGAESNPSPPSNVVAVTAQSISIQIDGPPVDGTTGYNVYVTANGFAESGPFLILLQIQEVDLTDNGTGSITIATKNYTALTGHVYTANDVGKQIIIGGTFTTVIDTVTDATHIIVHDNAPGTVVGAATVINAFLNGVPRAIEIEWSDGELILSQTPPIDHDPPPSGTSCAAIGNVMNVGGCYSGVGWACSDAGQPEAFNPDNVSFLSEPLQFPLGRPQDGFIYLVCANSISAAVYTGAVNGPPVMVRQIWDRVGCAGFASAAIFAKTLYLFTNGKKIARIDPNGNLDYEFSKPINAEIASWDASKVVVGYSDERQAMCFIHNQEILCFHMNLPNGRGGMGRWSTPLNLAAVTGSGNPTGNITGAYTNAGKLYLLAFESANYNIYKFDESGAGVSTWFFTTGWQTASGGLAPAEGFRGTRISQDLKTTKKILLDYSSSTDIALAGGIYNFNLGTGAFVRPISTTLPHAKRISKWMRANIKAGRIFAVNFGGTGAGQKFYALEVEGVSSRIH